MASESGLVGLNGKPLHRQPTAPLVGPDGNPIKTISDSPRRTPEEMERKAFEEKRDTLEAMMRESNLINANCKLCFGRGYRSFVAVKNRAGEVVANQPLVCECVGKRLKRVSDALELKKTLNAKEYIENPYFWGVR